MKKFNATFKVIHWFNGGKRESTVIKEIEARTLTSATNKARKIEQYAQHRTWYLLENVVEGE